jgi:hypothetical protein
MGRRVCRLLAALLFVLFPDGAFLLVGHVALAETCTTQSEMQPADRDHTAGAALLLSVKIQANDIAGLRPLVSPEYDKDPGPMTGLVAGIAPKLKDAAFVLQQIYLLDASTLKPGVDGKPSDAEFFCTLNRSPAAADFLIPGLPAGRYAFVIVHATGTKTPWSLSFLLRQEHGWLMAGLYPKPLTAAGHDGVWYWTQARVLSSQRQRWNAYLYYREAQTLLQPVNFVSSTNLEQLKKEAEAITPPALSSGVSPATPLVVKAADGAEYRFTDLVPDDSLGGDQLDVAVHLEQEESPESAAASQAVPDAAPQKKKAAAPAPLAPKTRSNNAMVALLAAYPELRSRFHGVWVFADVAGQSPVVTEQSMAQIH